MIARYNIEQVPGVKQVTSDKRLDSHFNLPCIYVYLQIQDRDGFVCCIFNGLIICSYDLLITLSDTF